MCYKQTRNQQSIMKQIVIHFSINYTNGNKLEDIMLFVSVPFN